MVMEAAELHDILVSGRLKTPVIFCKKISHWIAAEWEPQQLKAVFGSQLLKFRIGKKSCKGVQWETQCKSEKATIDQLLEWIHVDGVCTDDNPLGQYSSDDYWCYADYMYMAYLFADQPQLLKAVDWSCFGFVGRDGTQSTLWLGSEGAHTPCHYDTYGCNLVAQISGRKRWYLFPPEQTDCLYPSRIPYEESSVFSQVNVKSPDLQTHSKFKNAVPYIVTLEPGQVLYVPHHWWHYVESLETSISINSWIELPVDDEIRLEEAVTRTVVTTLMEGDQTLTVDTWLNPTEEPSPHEINMKYINQSLLALKGSKPSQPGTSAAACSNINQSVSGISNTDHLGALNRTEKCSSTKKRKMDDSGDKSTANTDTSLGGACIKTDIDLEGVKKIGPSTFEEYLDVIGSPHLGIISQKKEGDTEDSYQLHDKNRLRLDPTSTQKDDQSDVKTVIRKLLEDMKKPVDTATLVNCVLHPKIVPQICDLLKECNEAS